MMEDRFNSETAEPSFAEEGFFHSQIYDFLILMLHNGSPSQNYTNLTEKACSKTEVDQFWA